MRTAKSICLFLAVLTCFTFKVSAQTTTSVDASTDSKKEQNNPAAASSAIAVRETDAKTASSTDGAVKGEAKAASAASAVNGEAKASAVPSPQGTSDKWHFTLAPYLWLAGINGTVGVGDLTTDIDPGVSDILNTLNFGFMGALEARKNRFMLINDLMYISLEQTKQTTGPLFSALKVNEKTFMLSPVAGYRLAQTEGASLDAIVGIRFWHTSTRLEAQPGVLAGRTAESSKNWADVIAGLRGQVHVTRAVSLIGRGDFGGGGSDRTYQLFGGMGIDVSKKASLFAGYRYLYFKYTRNDFLFDGALNGVVLGAALHF